MSNDIVYVLSASFNSRTSSQMYVTERFLEDGRNIATIKLSEAKVFATEATAREQRITMDDSGWQITPISAKRIFETKLKGT